MYLMIIKQYQNVATNMDYVIVIYLKINLQTRLKHYTMKMMN